MMSDSLPETHDRRFTVFLLHHCRLEPLSPMFGQKDDKQKTYVNSVNKLTMILLVVGAEFSSTWA